MFHVIMIMDKNYNMATTTVLSFMTVVRETL